MAISARAAAVPASAGARDPGPLKPIRYGPAARLADRWAGRVDGKAGIPPVPAELPDRPDPSLGATPYVDVRVQHFHDQAEREHRHGIHALEASYTRLAELDRRIAHAREVATELGLRLDEIPVQAPPDVMKARNGVEQHAPEELIRARRQREHTAVRNKIAAEQRQARAILRDLEAERDQLARAVDVAHRIITSRVRQLHRHTLRRIGTYRRRLQRSHAAGPAVLPLFDMSLPGLPGWVADLEIDAAHLAGAIRPETRPSPRLYPDAREAVR
jgi:hypothetical protein